MRPRTHITITLLLGVLTAAANSLDELHTRTANRLEETPFPCSLDDSQGTSEISRRDHVTTWLAPPGINITISDPVPPTKKKNILIRSIADFALPRVLKKLSDVSNYFISADKDSIVYFDKDIKNWVLHTFDGASTQMLPSPGMGVPLARCLSTAHGGNGYVTAQLDLSVYADMSLSAPVEVMLLETQVDVLATLSSGMTVGGAASFTGSVTCNAAPGQYTQPYLYPYFFEVPRGRRVRTRYVENKGLENFGEWTETPAMQRLVATALLECAVGNDTSICDHSVPRLWKDAGGMTN